MVHGRAGGEIPEELQALAAAVEESRKSPVRLQALSACEQPAFPSPEQRLSGLTLVPLFLLPGHHVRHDIKVIAADWRRQGPLRRLPFLGAWPLWQRALAEAGAEVRVAGRQPVWWHHPLEGPLAARYLRHLERVIEAPCRPAEGADSYTQASPARDQVALPLALAANRLTDQLGPPLLQRLRFHQVLLQRLVALP